MAEKLFYITKEKFEEVKKEYKNLLALELKKAKGDVPKVFESEDMNPEYVNFQEDLSFLRSRISELESVIKNHEIIKKPDNKDIVNVGSTVVVDIDGEKDEFVITGTLEANPNLGKISNESPVGRALLGHKIGEKVVVSSPLKTTYTIKKIKYFSA